MKAFLIFLFFVFVIEVTMAAHPTSAQKSPSERFKHAIERSGDSARLLSLLAAPDSGIPKELFTRAEVVAIFPRASRQDALVRRFLQGYGVIGARQGDGWSLPAFYQFASAPRKFSGSSEETLAIILLFLSNDARSSFEKDKAEFKGDRAATLGPVGINKDEQNPQAALGQIVAYTYYNGKLNAKNIDPAFFRDFVLEQDNNINAPLYGVKGREILAGKKIDPASLPVGISAFQEALQKCCVK
jgi:lipid-binding SYLF domain-containing protein